MILKRRWAALAALSVLGAFWITGCQKQDVQPESELTLQAETTDPYADVVIEGDQEADRYAAEPDYIKEARAKNKEVIGWITVPNTSIDYPVLLTGNNEYYIDHDIDGSVSKSGAIFMDYRNANMSERRHLILYGHNMKNGTMFHDLNNFKKKDFFQNAEKITLWLWGEERKYEVFAQSLPTTDVGFIQTKFSSDTNFVSFVNDMKALSKFETEFEPSANDEILTMSTCTYEYENTRCVVLARRVQ